MRIFVILFSCFALGENVQTGNIYLVKKLKYFAPKGEDKNSVAHFILYKDSKKKHVIEIFCLLPQGEDPNKAKSVLVGERSKDPSPGIQYFCDLNPSVKDSF